MKIKKLLIFLLLLVPVGVLALEITSARTVSLGEIATVLEDDVDALRFNPATLGYLRRPQVNFTYARIYPQLEDSSNIFDFGLAAGFPVKKFNFGFIWDERRLDSLYSERYLNLGIAKSLNKFCLGVNVRILSRGYGTNEYFSNAVDDSGFLTETPDPLFAEKKEVYKFSLDAGGYWQKVFGLNDWALALAVKDIFEPDMAIGNVADVIRRKILFGISWHPEKILIAIGASKSFSDSGDYVVGIGLERGWQLFQRSKCFLRSGLSTVSGSAKASLGLGYQEDFIKIDYSFVLPFFAPDIGGIHKITFGLTFGTPPPGEKYYQKELERARKELQIKQEELKNLQEEKVHLQEELNRTLTDITDYQKQLEYYQKVVATMSVTQPAMPPERKVTEKPGGEKTEVPKPPQKEPEISLRREKLRQEYYSSLSYYYKLRELGISPKERYDILIRIRRKYQELGELKEVKEELKKINSFLTP